MTTMSTMTADDADLIARHHAGSDDAFAAIVRRHADWIAAVARRRVGGDGALADDVVQATFLVLAQRSRTLPAGVALPAWLFRVACNVSSRAVRDRARLARRERVAADLRSRAADDGPGDEAWAALAPILDELVERLRQSDREAILLRFYRQLQFAEVGRALGVGEEAARKRVGRAVERLRDAARRRGIEVGATAALAALLTTHASAGTATAGTVAVATTAATSLTVAGGNAATLAKGATAMAISGKTAVAVLAAAVAAAATIGGVVAFRGRAPASPAAKPAAAASAPADDAARIDAELAKLNQLAKGAMSGYRDAEGRPRLPPTLGALFEDSKSRAAPGATPAALAGIFLGPNPPAVPAEVSAEWVDRNTSLVFVMRGVDADPADLVKQLPDTVVVHTPLDRPLRAAGGRDVALVVRVDGRAQAVDVAQARREVAAAEALAAPIRLDATRRATMSHMLRVALAVNAAAAASGERRLPATLGESFPFLNRVGYATDVDETAYLTRADLDRLGGVHEPTAQWIDAHASYEFLAANVDASKLSPVQRERTAMLHTRLDAPLKNRGGADMFLIAFLDGHVEEFRGLDRATAVLEASRATLHAAR